MASTNTKTSNNNISASDVIINTDIYDISNFVDTVRANNVDDISDTASMVGMFGYLNEMFSQSIQNNLVVVSETSNETIATRAKFSKNILAHVFNYGIKNIYATPSSMTLMIYLPLNYMFKEGCNFVKTSPSSNTMTFIFDKNIPINIGDFEFHVDYDILITRTEKDGKYHYSAMYDLFEPGTTVVKQNNPISDIFNPYITTLVQYTISNVDYLAFSVRAHQCANVYIENNILTSNPLENKITTFNFDDQIAAFDVEVIENDKSYYLTPVYSGLIDYEIADDLWCTYEFLDENTIRIKFDRDSYVPSLNALVKINVKICEGSKGNFTYNTSFRTSLSSEEYNNYNGMYMLIYPLQNGVANGGRDKKSIADLKKIIPREASSRGAIINTTDLQNYFNSINDTNSKIYFDKKRDNPFERLYYAHLLMKKGGNVYPTNTLNITMDQSDFKGFSANNNLTITPGMRFYYYKHSDEDNDYATLVDADKVEFVDDPENEYNYPITRDENGNIKRVFEYVSPFLVSIDDDLITSYLLTIVNDNKTFKFDSINTESPMQFVATNMDWVRKYIYEDIDENGNTVEKVYDNKYVMTLSAVQNNQENYNMVKYEYDANGDMQLLDIRTKIFLVLYADETNTNPYKYIEGTLIKYDPAKYVYDFEFVLTSDDLMDINNRINISGTEEHYLYNAKPEEFQKMKNINNSHGYMNKNTFAKIFILADFGNKVGDIVDGKVITEETAKDIIYGVDGVGNRSELESLVPTRNDIVEEFLKNNIEFDAGNEVYNVVNIIKSNPDYLKVINEYNNNEQNTKQAIMKYLNNPANIHTDFVQNVLLKDELSLKVINSYYYEDLSKYSVCNTFTVDNGIDFYYDYSNMMSSNVTVQQIPLTDENGNELSKEIEHTDSQGNTYKEYIPLFKVNEDGTYYYNYRLYRFPFVKAGFINSDKKMKDFIFDLEERRKYINECLAILEDTFGIDLKFFNTYGPSNRFYYNELSDVAYQTKVTVKSTIVYKIPDDSIDMVENLAGNLEYGEIVTVVNSKGQWGQIINKDFDDTNNIGWVKLSDCTRVINYIDNVALTMKFALEAFTSADRNIAMPIISDIKEYTEDINEVTELHVPNIITLITNNYREQLVYFEFLDINGFGSTCQHLYLDETKDVETTPEFLNISIDDYTELPNIDVVVY